MTTLVAKNSSSSITIASDCTRRWATALRKNLNEWPSMQTPRQSFGVQAWSFFNHDEKLLQGWLGKGTQLERTLRLRDVYQARRRWRVRVPERHLKIPTSGLPTNRD